MGVPRLRALTLKSREQALGIFAIDRAQAGVGDRVIVLTEGTGVRQILAQGDIVPIRSAIVGIVDTVDIVP